MTPDVFGVLGVFLNALILAILKQFITTVPFFSNKQTSENSKIEHLFPKRASRSHRQACWKKEMEGAAPVTFINKQPKPGQAPPESPSSCSSLLHLPVNQNLLESLGLTLTRGLPGSPRTWPAWVGRRLLLAGPYLRMQRAWVLFLH